jgi:hypothetical protein
MIPGFSLYIVIQLSVLTYMLLRIYLCEVTQYCSSACTSEGNGKDYLWKSVEYLQRREYLLVPLAYVRMCS